MDERVFERRLPVGDAGDIARECIDYIAHELMAARSLDPNGTVDELSFQTEAIANLSLQSLRRRRLHHHDVATDVRLQLVRYADPNQRAAVHDRDAITAFGFVHEVSGEDHGDTVLIAQM